MATKKETRTERTLRKRRERQAARTEAYKRQKYWMLSPQERRRLDRALNGINDPKKPKPKGLPVPKQKPEPYTDYGQDRAGYGPNEIPYSMASELALSGNYFGGGFP